MFRQIAASPEQRAVKMNGLFRISASMLKLIPLLLVGLSFDLASVRGQESETPPHAHIQTLTDERVNGLVSLVGSKDGKFLYGAALGSKGVVTLSRDPETGKVEVVDLIEGLKGSVCLAISKDQKWVVLTSCLESLVTLYSRDAETGMLTEVSSRKHGMDEVEGLEFPIAVTISPDSRFVYVTNAGGTGSLTAFSIENDKLKFLQQHEGVDGCMKGARLLTVDPDGEFLFVACAKANCLTVFDRDTDNGRLRVLHYMPDDEDRCNLLAGAHGVVCSNDGRHLYVSSGRFSGDNGISVFEILQREVLELVQELEDGKDLKNFTAGNHIGISPDGKYVYATTATSGKVFCFERDAKSGQLKYLYDLQVEGETQLGRMAGVFVSSDNRFVYVADEGEKQRLYVFERQVEDASQTGNADQK